MTGDILWLGTIIGIGATIVMDIWAYTVSRTSKLPAPNWAVVGRWISHFPRGMFWHNTILQAQPIQGETIIGWATHYLTGIVYGIAFIYLVNVGWLEHPTPMPPLLFGIITVLVPFLVMQPCLGFGIAASKTPSPWKARLVSVLNHSFFGLGLYLSAEALVALRYGL